MAGPQPTADQRRRIRRTALALGAIALAIYLGFIASGVMNSAT